MNRSMNTLTAVATVVAALGLAACGQRDNHQAAAQSSDQTMAQADQRADQTTPSTERMRDQASEAAQDAKSAVKDAGQKVADKVSDAVITTTVKAELAKDSNLSAMKINVDTDEGKVLLRGTAPSQQAREHATALAGGVKGVVSVENELTVEPAK